MTLAAHDGDPAFAAGGKRSGADRRHLALKDERQDIAARHCRPAVVVPPFNDEAIRLEADMAPAGDLQESF